MGVRGVSAAGRTPGHYALVAYPPGGYPGAHFPGTPYPHLVGGSTPRAGAVYTAPTRTPTGVLDSTHVGPNTRSAGVILEVLPPAALSGWGACKLGGVRVLPPARHTRHIDDNGPHGGVEPPLCESAGGGHTPPVVPLDVK